MKNKILIVGGDPNSINSEIIYKCWKKSNSAIRNKIYIITNYKLFKKQLSKLKYPLKILKVGNYTDHKKSKKLKIIDIPIEFNNPFKIKKKFLISFISKSLNYAHSAALKSDVKGIINCAIDKSLLKKNNTGVTEYLASKCKIKNQSEVMMISNLKFSVVPITTHIDVRQISRKITKRIIINKLKTIDKFFKNTFKIKPRIGVLGLNPHNSEMKKKSEEVKIILPSIRHLKKRKINCSGPHVSDTIFIKDYKNFDVIVGMFHDQVLIPFKTLYKFNAINITLGLKYLRVSPDHGTAVNLIGKNKANADSLIKCIQFIEKFGK